MRKALWIGDDIAVCIAADLPAVVDVHILISGIFHAGFHHGIGHAPDHVSLTLQANLFQEFQPIGGVRASFFETSLFSCAPRLEHRNRTLAIAIRICLLVFMKAFYQKTWRFTRGQFDTRSTWTANLVVKACRQRTWPSVRALLWFRATGSCTRKRAAALRRLRAARHLQR